MAKSTERRSDDIGLESTIAWLQGSANADAGFSVTPITLPYPDLANSSGAELARFDSLRSGNQSLIHSTLKLAAYSWLRLNSLYPETIESEVVCYAPPKREEEGRSVLDGLGLEIDIYSPHVIYKNFTGFPLSYGDHVRSDLHTFDFAMEVGATQPKNLLLPLQHGLADYSVWIPYPDETKDNGLNKPLVTTTALQGYKVRLHTRPKARRYRTPAKNLRGPHPYPINQWQLIDWLIEKYGQRAPRYAERRAISMFQQCEPSYGRNWLILERLIKAELAGQDHATSQ